MSEHLTALGHQQTERLLKTFKNTYILIISNMVSQARWNFLNGQRKHLRYRNTGNLNFQRSMQAILVHQTFVSY